MKQPIAALVLAAALAGCATDGGPYPSLAPRAIEKGSFDEPIRPVAVATPDAALEATLATKGEDLARIAAGFDAAAEAARRSLARPGATTIGSDAWLDAQGALARLDEWRTQATALATDVEALGSARAARLDPPYPALDALAARVAPEADRESAAIDALQRRPSGG